jgi:glycosyltransferase involved in cell wall biosynthesis
MRILFIGPLPEPVTGMSLACQVLFDDLKTRHAVDVVNLSKAGFAQGADSIHRVLEVASLLGQVARLRSNADVIYFTIAESRAGNAKDLAIYLLCLGKLDRMVIHLHGGAGIRELLRDRASLTSRLNGFFLKRLGGIIVLGQRHLPIFAGTVAPDRLHIVPNFAEDAIFSTPVAINGKFSHEFTPASPLRLLFLSNLLPGKGHAELVAAFGLLEPEIRDRLRIDFAGGFEADEHKSAFLASIKDQPQLAYHGSVRGAAKIDLFQNAHVFCLPTYYPYEGQPISILEAYAAGCAVITTDHSGIFDVFSDAVNGFGVEKKSAASLADGIRRALASRDDTRRIALNNNELADRTYRTTHFNARLTQLIEACPAT